MLSLKLQPLHLPPRRPNPPATAASPPPPQPSHSPPLVAATSISTATPTYGVANLVYAMSFPLPSSTPKSGLSTAAIAGIGSTIGVILLLTILSLCYFFFFRKHPSSKFRKGKSIFTPSYNTTLSSTRNSQLQQQPQLLNLAQPLFAGGGADGAGVYVPVQLHELEHAGYEGDLGLSPVSPGQGQPHNYEYGYDNPPPLAAGGIPLQELHHNPSSPPLQQRQPEPPQRRPIPTRFPLPTPLPTISQSPEVPELATELEDEEEEEEGRRVLAPVPPEGLHAIVPSGSGSVPVPPPRSEARGGVVAKGGSELGGREIWHGLPPPGNISGEGSSRVENGEGEILDLDAAKRWQEERHRKWEMDG
ncbi:hypothetical protein G7Y89_g8376 [Cudoniella acicularis]|uniref:Transmembrane protein n=1 Tax=Cudoniella acicularis TaxID=354080 RepID=A0A8H4RJ82_9HELO|nr:hypothetical protein G7Y89_g8376 [Cudoniella acicularis]